MGKIGVDAATVIGAVIGGRLTAVFKPDALRIAFGWVMLPFLARKVWTSIIDRDGGAPLVAYDRDGEL